MQKGRESEPRKRLTNAASEKKNVTKEVTIAGGGVTITTTKSVAKGCDNEREEENYAVYAN